MSVVRGITIVGRDGAVKFRFDSTGLPERPVIMHACAHCLSDAAITNKDAGDLAAWLIGEAVDDAHGNGVLAPTPPEGVQVACICSTVDCKQYGERVLLDHAHDRRPAGS